MSRASLGCIYQLDTWRLTALSPERPPGEDLHSLGDAVHTPNLVSAPLHSYNC